MSRATKVASVAFDIFALAVAAAAVGAVIVLIVFCDGTAWKVG